MIEILMAVYNGENFIAKQIESILWQEQKDWKLLIHDDGSTDGTVSIAEEYQQKYPDKIQILQDGICTGGAKHNFMHLLKHSKAPYVMFADQDDVWQENKVKEAYKKIREMETLYGTNTPLLVHGDLKVVDEKLDLIDSSMFSMQKLEGKRNQLADFLVQNNVTGCTVIMNRALIRLCNEMPGDAIMHDWWLALIAAAFGKVGFMEEACIFYRQHAHNTEGAKNLKDIRYSLEKVFQKKEIRNTLELTYRQAECFQKIFGKDLTKEQSDMVDAYVRLRNMTKTEKFKTIKKYGFRKSGVVRQLGYLFYL